MARSASAEVAGGLKVRNNRELSNLAVGINEQYHRAENRKSQA